MKDRPSVSTKSYRRRYRGWMAIGLVAVLMVLLSLGTDATREALRYERVLILHGEYWRLLTAHLVHFDKHHLVLNLAGLALMTALFPAEYSAAEWVMIAVVSALSIDIGFLWLRPAIDWYVGASGVLHGILAAGAIMWWRQQPPWLAGALSIILVGKLTWEQTHGALPLSGYMPVLVDAHLFGAIGGACVGLVTVLLRRPRPQALSAG